VSLKLFLFFPLCLSFSSPEVVGLIQQHFPSKFCGGLLWWDKCYCELLPRGTTDTLMLYWNTKKPECSPSLSSSH
jgi:hypothetical protein